MPFDLDVRDADYRKPGATQMPTNDLTEAKPAPSPELAPELAPEAATPRCGAPDARCGAPNAVLRPAAWEQPAEEKVS